MGVLQEIIICPLNWEDGEVFLLRRPNTKKLTVLLNMGKNRIKETKFILAHYNKTRKSMTNFICKGYQNIMKLYDCTTTVLIAVTIIYMFFSLST